MTTNVTIKTKIVFNGKEYASPEDMPAVVRALYERAMATVTGVGQQASSTIADKAFRVNVQTRSKISIAGHEYASPEDMPADVRRLYERAIAEIEPASTRRPGLPPADSGEAADSSRMATPLGPSSTFATRVVLGLLLVAVVLWLLAR